MRAYLARLSTSLATIDGLPSLVREERPRESERGELGYPKGDARDFAVRAVRSISSPTADGGRGFLRTARGGSYSLLGIRQQRLTANQAQHLPAERRGTASEREGATEGVDDGEGEREGRRRRAPFVTRPANEDALLD